MPARTKARYTADSDGTGPTRRLASSNTSRRGPQYGRGSRPVEWCKSGRVSACGSVVATMP
ncbi:hypothetical protein MAHJHV63_54850 [Mycobacterium avium subsp. hominissuis]